MNVKRLMIEGSDKPVADVCGKCGSVHSLNLWGADQAREFAEACCKCRTCGIELEPHHSQCQPCRDKEWREREEKREAERRAKAQHVPLESFTDYVFLGENVEDDHDLIREWCDEHGADAVWAASPYSMTIDAERIVEDALGNHHEDASESISTEALTELQVFLDGWCERNRVTSYEEDHSILVVVR